MDLLEYLKRQIKRNPQSKDTADGADTPGTPTGAKSAIVPRDTVPGTPNPRKTSIPMGTSPTVPAAGADTRTLNPAIARSVPETSKIEILACAIMDLLDWQRDRMEYRKAMKAKRMAEAQRKRNRDKDVENKGVM